LTDEIDIYKCITYFFFNINEISPVLSVLIYIYLCVSQLHQIKGK